MSEERRAIRFRVTGRVQGVSFRDFTRRSARRLGVAGWVRNCPDGAVEGEAAGSPAALADFALSLRQGPPMSRVDRLEEEALAVLPDWRDFEIRF